jgi:hypothetical protein
MKFFLRALRSSTITYSKSDLLTVSLIAAVVAVWVAVASGAFSFPLLVACQAVFFAFYFVGSSFASFRRLTAGILSDLPLRLLVGYGVVNTTLLALAWLSPFGIIANFAIVLALVLTAFFAAGQRKCVPADSASLWIVALCLVASSLWCQDSIHPRAEQGSVVVFKPWVDGFYHAVHIRIFAQSHGASSIEDWRLAGEPARPYHYGMYLLPAFLKQASGIDSYSAFAGILAPVGVFFTGLAAYAFFGSLWGAWPGLAAAAALLLLPDGAQQGMHNTFMSYHWLTQISPSATYGLALLAVAWLFVIQGSTRGSWLQLCAGWSFATIVLVYKLHYVVASALLLLLVPAIFFRGRLGAGRRALWIAAACAVYALALIGGQKAPGVPLIRFDGSSVGEILRLVHTFATPGALRDYVVQHSGARFSTTSNLLFGIPYVLLAVFGLLLPLLLVLVVRMRRRTSLLHVLFPVLLIANFLAMFFGLALDFASSTPDELSHRPLMIVYFFVVGWIGGALGLTLIESRQLNRLARPAIVGLAMLLMAVPARFGAGVQQLWAMPQMSPVRLPMALIHVADYLRHHGGPEEVFQDSQFDRIYALAALSERRVFVAHTMTLVPFRADIVEARTDAIGQFMEIRQARAVRPTARAFGFRWFVLERGDRVAWPAEIANKSVLNTGPFKLYEL